MAIEFYTEGAVQMVKDAGTIIAFLIMAEHWEFCWGKDKFLKLTE
mgnify:FL=1